jgi:hypothetical protein
MGRQYDQDSKEQMSQRHILRVKARENKNKMGRTRREDEGLLECAKIRGTSAEQPSTSTSSTDGVMESSQVASAIALRQQQETCMNTPLQANNYTAKT